MKDPAFLFYSGDFLAGTQFLTYEQRGKYITLLCMQHQQGHIKDKHMLMICGGDDEVPEKFVKDANGLYYHPRMEIEIEKRKKYSESRRNNRMGEKGQKGKGQSEKQKQGEKGLSEKEEDSRKEKERGKEREKEQITYPYESADFMKVWGHWKDYKSREHGFKYASAQSEQAALKRLVRLSGGMEQTAMEIIVESMANGWKGLFELQNNHKHGRGNNSNGENNPGIKQAIFDIIGDTTGCF